MLKINYQKNSPYNYFVITNQKELPILTKWNYDLVYMLISHKMSSFVWQNQNFFLINLVDLKNQSNSPNGEFYKKEVNQNKLFLNNAQLMKQLNYQTRIDIPLELNN